MRRRKKSVECSTETVMIDGELFWIRLGASTLVCAVTGLQNERLYRVGLDHAFFSFMAGVGEGG